MQQPLRKKQQDAATPNQAFDLRSTLQWLRSNGELIETDKEVDPDLQVTGLQKHLDGGCPVIFNKVKGKPNHRVLTNLFGDMKVINKMFGWKDDPERVRKLAYALSNPLKPVEIPLASGEVGRFEDGGASNAGWATSSNSGSTWTHGFLPGTTVFATPPGPYARVSDPAVAFDADHNVWLISTLALNSSVTGTAVIVNRSTNGGTTWTNPVTVTSASSGQSLDKDWIVCDDTSTSPDYGHCYVEWDDNGHGNLLHMARSTDGGQTWTNSTVPSSTVIGGQPLVQPNGTVVVPIDNAFEGAVESFVSTNGGSSYTGPSTISSISSHTEAGDLRSGPLPTAEIDGSGKVYVVWEDCRFESGCSANDLVMSTSTNGTTWSAVTRIPIDAVGSGVDHFIPGLAVDKGTSGSSAHLGLAYYYYPAAPCHAATCQLYAGVITSRDGGATWAAPRPLAGPMSLGWLPRTTLGAMVGDYIATAFSGGDAIAVLAIAGPPRLPGATLDEAIYAARIPLSR